MIPSNATGEPTATFVVRAGLLVFYGPLVASTYLMLKSLGGLHPEVLLGAASALAAILVCLVVPRHSFIALKEKEILLRGLFFALAQVLLVSSFAKSNVASSLVAAMAGTVVAYYLHRARDRQGKLSVSVALFAVTAGGVGLLIFNVGFSPVAWIAGVLQGASFFLLKRITSKKIHFLATQFPILLFTGVLGLGRILFVGAEMPGGSVVFFASCLLLFAQVVAYWTNCLFDGRVAAVIGGTRIPYSILFDRIYSGVPIRFGFVFGALLILCGFAFESTLAKEKSTNESVS